MELSLALTAIQSVATKISFYGVEHDIYDVDIARGSVRFQGHYSPEFMKNIILAKLENFKQLPIMDNGFISMSFTCEGIDFTIILT